MDGERVLLLDHGKWSYVDESSLPEEPLRPEALCFGTSSTKLTLNGEFG